MTRREYLLAAIQATQLGTEWSTQQAALVLAVSPWACHRNTARKDMRAFARRGHLAPDDTGPHRIYIRTTPDSQEEVS